MPRSIKIAVINSLSFTGTTWLNLVLGSHRRAFTLGPPDRVMNLEPCDRRAACRVHTEDCPFWSQFFARFDPDENFFVQLADHAERDVILINNPLPNGAARQLEHRRIELRRICLVRDGRAIAASHHRKYPETSFLESVRDWLEPSFSTFAFDPADPDRLCMRYEDVLADQRGSLERFGRFLGIDYDESALAYWEHEHHIAAGNLGAILMIKLAQNLPIPEKENRAFLMNRAYYEAQLEALRANPEQPFADERWHEELSRRDLFVFDHFCGAVNARFGYERDRFTVDEMRTFESELDLALGTGSASRQSVPAIEPTQVHPATPGLRAQVWPSWWRRHGLRLTPRQSIHLAWFGALAILILLAAAVTITASMLL